MGRVARPPASLEDKTSPNAKAETGIHKLLNKMK